MLRFVLFRWCLVGWFLSCVVRVVCVRVVFLVYLLCCLNWFGGLCVFVVGCVLKVVF